MLTPKCSDLQRLNAFAMRAAQEQYRSFISIKDRLRFEKHLTKKSMRERARKKLEKGQTRDSRLPEDYRSGDRAARGQQDYFSSAHSRYHFL